MINNYSPIAKIFISIILIFIFVYGNKLNRINNINNKLFYNENKDMNIKFKNVSVIIPVYNCEKTINYSILSIKKQNLTNLEIILVNDFSKDNSLNIIKEFMKNDSRIKLINNKENRGTLYSRSIGALSAKGEYIFSLDNDDEFFGIDSLDYIYNQAKEGDHDIIYFRKFSIRNKSILKLKLKKFILKNNHYNMNNRFKIINQPELSIYPISKNKKYSPNSFFIWDKCIKTKIYQQAVKMLFKDINSKNISYNEDIIIIFIIFSISKSMKIINKLGIIHYLYNNSTARTRKYEYKIYCDIYLLDILFRFSKNNSYKNFCVDYFVSNMKFISKNKNKENNLYLIKVLNKIIIDKYITEKNKLILKTFIKKLEDKKLN